MYIKFLSTYMVNTSCNKHSVPVLFSTLSLQGFFSVAMESKLILEILANIVSPERTLKNGAVSNSLIKESPES